MRNDVAAIVKNAESESAWKAGILNQQQSQLQTRSMMARVLRLVTLPLGYGPQEPHEQLSHEISLARSSIFLEVGSKLFGDWHRLAGPSALDACTTSTTNR